MRYVINKSSKNCSSNNTKMESDGIKKVEKSKKRKGKENSSLFLISQLQNIRILSTFRDGYE